MEAEVAAAIVAAVAALIVAVISLVTAMWSSRSAAESARGIERLKSELADSQRRQELHDSGVSEAITALRAGLAAAQRVKDEIQLTLAATDTRLRATTILGRLAESREQVFAAYEQHHMNLSIEEQLPFHKAKGVAEEVEREVTRALKEHAYASAINNEAREAIGRCHAQLTDLQHQMRDAMAGRVNERMALWQKG